MDKVIIDGVDVSGCEFYFEDNGVIAPDRTPERANICTSPERSCENNDSCYCNKDCYYKQLKRLQTENEELKEQLDNQFKLCSDCSTTHSFNLQVSENKKLQAEYDNLQGSHSILKTTYLELQAENENLEIDIGIYKGIIDSDKEENERLKEEIRVAQMNRMTMFEKLDIVNEKDTYKQALQEIREIANKHDYWRGSLQSATNIINEILDKINSAIGAE